jgi:HK97 gp10 family phage protein
MSVDFDISQLTKLADDLGAAGSRVKVEADKELAATAIATRNAAQAAAPMLTGELRASIHVEVDGDQHRVVADAEHAAYVEFGTSDTAPQPYMWPAADRANERLSEAVVELGDPFTP